MATQHWTDGKWHATTCNNGFAYLPGFTQEIQTNGETTLLVILLVQDESKVSCLNLRNTDSCDADDYLPEAELCVHFASDSPTKAWSDAVAFACRAYGVVAPSVESVARILGGW